MFHIDKLVVYKACLLFIVNVKGIQNLSTSVVLLVWPILKNSTMWI